MILVAYRHGLRASELVDLRWDQVDFEAATLAVRRGKKGSPSTHPIRGDELQALRRLRVDQVLAAAQLGIGLPLRSDCSALGGRPHQPQL